MSIARIDGYVDPRFSKRVLQQHGAFLLNGTDPYEVEITDKDSAVVRGKDKAVYPDIIGEFRFYAEHIIRFYGADGSLIQDFPAKELFWVELAEIQPTQFYIDEEKLSAVESFIRRPEDAVIPLVKLEERYLACDGHTRLYAAYRKGFRKVRGFLTEPDDYLTVFAGEAKKRGIYQAEDMECLVHEAYVVKWHRYCEDFFREME